VRLDNSSSTGVQAAPLEIDPEALASLMAVVGDRWDRWHHIGAFDRIDQVESRTGRAIGIFTSSPAYLGKTKRLIALLRGLFPAIKDEPNARYTIVSQSVEDGEADPIAMVFMVDPCGKVLSVLARPMDLEEAMASDRPVGILYARSKQLGTTYHQAASNEVRRLSESLRGSFEPLPPGDPCNVCESVVKRPRYVLPGTVSP
jgi:hypothetical protein